MAGGVDLTDFDTKFASARTKILAHVAVDLFAAGSEVLRRSGQQVPFDHGTLSDSGDVSQPMGTTEISVDISYDTPYAARWHENEANFQHGRKSHYLSDPVRDFYPAFASFMSQKLSALFS